MFHKIINRIAARLFAVTALVCSVAISTMGQPDEKLATAVEPDSTGKADSAEVKKSAAREAQSTTGWLILDGELIPGPYNIVVHDSSITVNGIPVVIPPARKEIIVVDSNVIARHSVSNALLERFHIWYAEEGIDTALRRSLEFMQRHPIIDTAYFASKYDLRIRFHGDDFEQFIWLNPPPKESPAPGIVLRENLEWYGQRLRMHLTSGSLVMRGTGGGGHNAILYPRSKSIMDELQRIASTIPDLEKRVDAVKQVIHDEEYARLIAERFMRE